MIEISNLARVELPKDRMIIMMVLGMYSYETKNGGSISTFQYKDGVAYLPTNKEKLEIVASLLDKKIVDIRGEGEPLESPFILSPSFKLRDYQVEPARRIVEKASEKDSFMLKGACSSGKTCTTAYALGQLGKKLLILVDQNSLAVQWQATFQLIYNKNSQLVKSSDKTFGDICIATLQMLHRNPNLLSRMSDIFGVIAVDEVHIIGGTATTFQNVMSSFSTKVRIGVTATPFAKNIPTGVLNDYIGSVEVEMLDRNALQAKVTYLSTGSVFSSDDPNQFSHIMSALAKDMKRNLLIAQTAAQYVSEGRSVLIVGITLVQLSILELLTTKLGCKPVTFAGTLSAKKEAELKRNIMSGEADVVLSVKMLEKGVDVPRLDTLILAKPTNNKRAVEQYVGRILRTFEGKQEPLVVDVVDEGFLNDIFSKNRAKWYGQLGCSF